MSLNRRSDEGQGTLRSLNARGSLGEVCDCGWETKFGYGVAVTLAIFEAKRFFMLALEMLAEWQVIRFAGGLRPVMLTSVDVTVGLPTALTAVYAIRKHKVPRCYTKTKRLLKYLLLIIAGCAVLNVLTLASIGYHISVKQKTLVKVFNASMRLYISAASYKYAVDEIQFVFQCCGHTSYTDWFVFDWQRVDYAARDEMINHNKISDEEYRGLGVPFSCCNLHSMLPCMHTEVMTVADAKTINVNGCAEIISPVLLRIVVIAYVMTCTLIVTQALLAFLIARMIERLLPGKCSPNCGTTYSSCGSSSVSCGPIKLRSTNGKLKVCTSPESPRIAGRIRKPFKARTKYAVCSPAKNHRRVKRRRGSATSSRCNSPLATVSMEAYSISDVASIKPSTHEEHTISKKRLYNKR